MSRLNVVDNISIVESLRKVLYLTVCVYLFFRYIRCDGQRTRRLFTAIADLEHSTLGVWLIDGHLLGCYRLLLSSIQVPLLFHEEKE